MPHIKVKVLAKHIAEGTRRMCGNCPIALAVWEQHVAAGTRGSVMVDHSVVYIPGLGWFSLSTEAKQFIKTFDDEGRSAVKPGVFILHKIPDIK